MKGIDFGDFLFMHVTCDDFLGGKVKLKQPEKGFRGTSDAVLLALLSGVKDGQTVLDVGCGTGIVLACLPAKKLTMTGIDIQEDLIALARENLPAAVFVIGDIAKTKMTATFDLVITNPPYFKEGAPSVARNLARHETVSLKQWLSFCMRRIKPKGRMVCILPAERADEALSILREKLGALKILPVFAKKEDPSAHAVILYGTLNAKTKTEILAPVYTDSKEIKERLRGK